MDYFDVLKKAWHITWRYKALWVLGLFAGAASGGGGSGGSGFQTGSSDYSAQGQQAARMYEESMRFVQDNLALLIVAGALLVLVGIVFWILSIAAQGGLVYGSNEAAEGRAPSLGAAWGVGFRHWGRTFMIGLVLGLPLLLVVGVMIGLFAVMIVGGVRAGDAGVGAILGGTCLVLPVFIVLIIGLSLIIGIVYNLALRYGVLADVTFGQAIKRGWGDLWGKRGAFVFWLVMLLPGVAYSILTLLLMLPFIVGSVALVFAGQFVTAAVVFVIMMFVSLLPGAIYGTFVSSAWTVFFRRMTGMESGPAPAVAAPAYPQVPAPPVGVPAPPAPPIDVQPPAPQAPPAAPPAPPTGGDAPPGTPGE